MTINKVKILWICAFSAISFLSTAFATADEVTHDEQLTLNKCSELCRDEYYAKVVKRIGIDADVRVLEAWFNKADFEIKDFCAKGDVVTVVVIGIPDHMQKMRGLEEATRHSEAVAWVNTTTNKVKFLTAPWLVHKLPKKEEIKKILPPK